LLASLLQDRNSRKVLSMVEPSGCYFKRKVSLVYSLHRNRTAASCTVPPKETAMKQQKRRGRADTVLTDGMDRYTSRSTWLMRCSQRGRRTHSINILRTNRHTDGTGPRTNTNSYSRNSTSIDLNHPLRRSSGCPFAP